MMGLAVCGPVRAASDLTVAAITAGRLYVVGRTDKPHTHVLLDGRFQTVSNDEGRFQYELLYHPARCVVSAVIEGTAYSAVVSNCAEQCSVPMAGVATPPSPEPTRPEQAPMTATSVSVPSPGANGQALPFDDRLAATSPQLATGPDSLPRPATRAVRVKRRPPPRSPGAVAEPHPDPAQAMKASQPVRGRRKPQPPTDAAPDDESLPVAD